MVSDVIRQGSDLTYRHLTVNEGGYAEILGSHLDVTHTQARILRRLMESTPDCVSCAVLAQDCLNTGSNGQVSVQIHHVNTLAQKITGRKLILNKRGTGYYLNPWM